MSRLRWRRRWSAVRCIVCWSTVTSTLVVLAFIVALAVTTSRPDDVTRPAPLPVEVGCGELSVDDVWVSGFAKLMTESALRLLDVNEDGILDVLLGFATGQHAFNPGGVLLLVFCNTVTVFVC